MYEIFPAPSRYAFCMSPASQPRAVALGARRVWCGSRRGWHDTPRCRRAAGVVGTPGRAWGWRSPHRPGGLSPWRGKRTEWGEAQKKAQVKWYQTSFWVIAVRPNKHSNRKHRSCGCEESHAQMFSIIWIICAPDFHLVTQGWIIFPALFWRHGESSNWSRTLRCSPAPYVSLWPCSRE